MEKFVIMCGDNAYWTWDDSTDSTWTANFDDAAKGDVLTMDIIAHNLRECGYNVTVKSVDSLAS